MQRTDLDGFHQKSTALEEMIDLNNEPLLTPTHMGLPDHDWIPPMMLL
jgi:hypothetical protein